MEAFGKVFTDELCDCHGPCHIDPDCPGGGGEFLGGGGWDEESVADLPPACELAAWYATHVPKETLYVIVEGLAQYFQENPDDPHAVEITDFINCAYALAP
jgi:hypothetical protein